MRSTANTTLRGLARGTLALGLLLFGQIPDAGAITVVTHYIGGPAPAGASGSGNLVEIFNAAARRWEAVYHDSFTITLYFGWAPLDSAATHSLEDQGGSPSRELAGRILFDNSGSVSFYMDPTPDSDEEYGRPLEQFQDLGGGLINVSRILRNPKGDAVGRCDLLSVALHEIGHALGMSNGNLRFGDESAAGHVIVGEDLPFQGTVIPLASNYAGVTSHVDPVQVNYGPVMAGISSDERRIPSVLDILANAQISGFRRLNLGAVPSSSPSSSILRQPRDGSAAGRGPR